LFLFSFGVSGIVLSLIPERKGRAPALEWPSRGNLRGLSPFGPARAWTRGNGTSASLQRDLDGRSRPSIGTTTYAINGFGRRVATTSSVVPTGTNYFVYDEGGRLIGGMASCEEREERGQKNAEELRSKTGSKTGSGLVNCILAR